MVDLIDLFLFAVAVGPAGAADAPVVTGLISGGGVLGVASIVGKFMWDWQKAQFAAMLESHKAHIQSLTDQLKVSNESHSKHLEKEEALVAGMNAMTTALVALSGRIDAAFQPPFKQTQ